MLKSIIGNLLLSPDAAQSVETPPPSSVETSTPETTTTTSTEVPEGTPTGEEQTSTGEVEDENPITLDDFLGAKNKPRTTDDLGTKKPAKEELKKDDKKDEDKKVEDKKEGTKLTTPAVKKFPSSRDYTGIPAEDVPMFQRMSNEAYDKFRPIYDSYQKQAAEIAQLKEQVAKIPQEGRLPDSYYENPNAYVLSPEYSQAAIEAQEAQSVLEHWRLQLDSVRSGATEYQTLVRDPKTGQINYGATVPVDEHTQSQIENIFFNANQQYNSFQQKLGAVKDSFSKIHRAAVDDLATFEKQFFAPYEDPKHALNPMIKDTLSKFNPAFRNNPMSPFVAKSIVTINALLNLLQQKQTKSPAEVAKEKVAAAQKKAGPTATGAGDASDKKDEEVTIDDFNAVKNS